jgi:hypothetical protein
MRYVAYHVFVLGGLVLLSGATQRQVHIADMTQYLGSTVKAMKEKEFAGDATLYQTKLEVDGVPRVLAFLSQSAGQMTGFRPEGNARLLIIIDESQECPDFLYEGMLSNATSPEAKLVLLGNPTRATGFFALAGKPNSGFETLSLSATDHPNLDPSSGIFIPNGPSELWIQDVADTYGRESDIYRSRVLGRWPQADQDSLFKLEWLEKAAAKDLTAQAAGSRLTFGIDVGRDADTSIVAIAQGPRLLSLRTLRPGDLMKTTGQIVEILQEFGVPRKRTAMEDIISHFGGGGSSDPLLTGEAGGQAAKVRCDMVGIGAGVVDRLRELGYRVEGYNGGRPSTDDKFLNLRAQDWWRLRTKLEKGDIAIPRNDKLWEELLAVSYETTSQGKTKIEDKKEIRKKLPGGRSPDRADAVVLAIAGSYVPDKVGFGFTV